MATVAEDVPSPRNSARKRVLMRGTLFAPDGAYVVWIRDLSTTGALVASKDRLPTNCDVIFKRGGIFAAAQIAWSNETGAGIKFYRELTDSDVASATVPLPSS
jgi:hypothetical protein